MSNRFNPKLKKGYIITCLEDCIIPGTGLTYFYFKGNTYKISMYLPAYFEKDGNHAWRITLLSGKEGSDVGWFTEDDLFKKFNANIYLRKEKLKKINEKANSAN